MREQCSFDTKASVAVILLARPSPGKVNLCHEHLEKVAAALGVKVEDMCAKYKEQQ